MAKCLLLGLGGTGSRIIDHVAKDLRKKNIRVNDGNICCAVIDTNGNDQKKIKENGNSIPVLATSKPRKVAAYLKKYGRPNKDGIDYDDEKSYADDWMPTSVQLLNTDMTNGAAQMRVKSRLAFYDTVKDGSTLELEREIEKLFNDRNGEPIRVMIVSSIAGGTGAGMFIQTAMWVRNLFKRKNCTDIIIRGILVLPDVFIRTVKGIRDDESQCRTLRANAYGAIRELNAITKAKTKENAPKLINPIKLDEVGFDSSDKPDGAPVFDLGFFMGAETAGGAALNSIEDYEKTVARLVYMQLFAPLSDDMYSEEDNLFRNIQDEKEPLYGSCGTAKAMYPVDSIYDYCSLKAAKNSLDTGWRKIDKIIEDILKRERQYEDDGAPRTNPRKEYIHQFNELSPKNEGKDKLLYNIRNDIKNSKIELDGDREITKYSDKIVDFMADFDQAIKDTLKEKNVGKMTEIKIKDTWVVDKEDKYSDTEAVKKFVVKKRADIERFVKEVETTMTRVALDFVNNVFPVDMGDVNEKNPFSVYGLLTKKDENGKLYFVHPIAVRYLIYSLAQEFEARMKLGGRLDAIKSKITTVQKGDELVGAIDEERAAFDIKKTKDEEDALTYLDHKPMLVSESRFLKEFRSTYSAFINNNQYVECEKYATNTLIAKVSEEFLKRLNTLIDVIEGFFRDLEKVNDTIDQSIAENVRETENNGNKVYYICATGKEKEDLYESLNFNTSDSSTKINAAVVESFYKLLCATVNPDADYNKPFVGMNIIEAFQDSVVSSYAETLREKYSNQIHLDLFAAICKASDLEFQRNNSNAREDANAKHERHIEAMKDWVARLKRNSAPFLNFVDDDERDTDTYKMFWGFNPALAESCKELGGILGVNTDTQASDSYDKCELDCYQANYGIKAENIDKFNEENVNENDNYYASYEKLINKINKNVADGDPEALVQTPHLDKTWHKTLPYISEKKRTEAQVAFFRNFWLAVAYGMITVNKEGQYQIERTKRTAMGAYKVSETLEYRGRAIFKTEISKLIELLQLDDSFERDVDEWDDKFKEEIHAPGNYVDTQFLNGLAVKEANAEEEGGEIVKNTIGGVASKGELNALTLMTRYLNSTGYNQDTLMSFRIALEELCERIGYKKHAKSDVKGLEKVKFDLCKRIYDACQLKDKDTLIVNKWKEMWTKHGLI